MYAINNKKMWYQFEFFLWRRIWSPTISTYSGCNKISYSWKPCGLILLEETFSSIAKLKPGVKRSCSSVALSYSLSEDIRYRSEEAIHYICTYTIHYIIEESRDAFGISMLRIPHHFLSSQETASHHSYLQNVSYNGSETKMANVTRAIFNPQVIA